MSILTKEDREWVERNLVLAGYTEKKAQKKNLVERFADWCDRKSVSLLENERARIQIQLDRYPLH